MKTLREYIDQLDEISRRGFLQGAGAAAVAGAAGGATGQSFTNQEERDRNTIKIAKIAAECAGWYWLAWEISGSKNETLKSKAYALSSVAEKYIGEKNTDNIIKPIISNDSYAQMMKNPDDLRQVVHGCDKFYVKVMNAVNTPRPNMESVQQGVAEESSPDALAKIDQVYQK